MRLNSRLGILPMVVLVSVHKDISAQQVRCYSVENEARLVQTVRGHAAARAQLATAVAARMAFLRQTALARRTGEVTIPVVVHVLWQTATQNISDAQIQGQIDVLNADFSGTNADIASVPSAFAGVLGSPRVRFALAQRAPDCSPTNGIHRVQTTVSVFSADDSMKFTSSGGTDAWPSTRYLNIWVCNMAMNPLGYAQFPNGPVATDGVVIDYLAFGTTGTATPPFHLGRTATHEVGHWLDLCHVFGCTYYGCSFTDEVDDTPPQQQPNGGCPTFPHVTCSNGPNGDMFMNFMDYVNDACMTAFTVGQSLRMEAVFDVARASFLSTNGHVADGGPGDLWMADTAVDVGNEPNLQSDVFWASDAIWVRNAADGGYVHQNPVYDPAVPSTVYVRVRNRSCTQIAAANLKLYWAKASTGLGWPAPWDGSVSSPEVMGGLVGVQSTGNMAAGETRVFQFAWATPNPEDYAPFDEDRSHFCLLARLEASATAPFGMTFPETGDLVANVRDNNSICWKNVSVAGGPMGESAWGAAANYGGGGAAMRLEVQLSRDIPRPVPAGALRLSLSPALQAAWLAGGQVASGLSWSPAAERFDVLSDNAWLGNLQMGPNARGGFEVRVGDGLRSGPKRTTVVRVVQKREPSLATVGGQDFVIPIGTDLDVAYALPFGVGCAGPSNLIPVISAQGLPNVPSQSFAVRVANGPAFQPGVITVDTGKEVQAFFGCLLFVEQPSLNNLFTFTDGFGAATVPVPVPGQTNLIGLRLFWQGFLLDGGGFAFSNALDTGIGR